MLLAHISDFHVFAGPDKPDLIRPDVADVVRKIVADIAAAPFQVDACMLTGDLAGNAAAEDYQLLQELLAPLHMPVFAIPGNHDAREPFRAAFTASTPFEDNTFLHYETRLGPLRILALDTTMDDGSVAGKLCPLRLEWIARKLSAPFTGITYILMHHAPYICGIPFLDTHGLVCGREEFGRLVQACTSELRILCGHVHRPSSTCWNGAFAMIGGSPAFTVALDFSGQDEPPLVDDPYAYYIHSLDASGEFSVSPRYVII